MRNILVLLLVFLPLTLFSQVTFTPGGFIRGGIYFSTGDFEDDINAAFGDAALTLNVSDNTNLRGYADIRFRTGQQYGENAGDIWLREAWGTYYNSILGISVGQKIVKWGKSDFFIPLSKFNPVDYSYRSPDREDMDLGNFLVEVSVTPASFLKLTAASAPLWNPSIIFPGPVELPYNINLDIPYGIQPGNGNISYGVRADITLRGADAGIQWYHGPDPMPGLILTNVDLSNIMDPVIEMKGVPYTINSFGADFEAAVSSVVMRGTLAWSDPVEPKEGNEEVPFPQIEWVAGFDWMPGKLRITAEYSGKKVLEYYASPYEPIIGQDVPFEDLLELFMTPGFDGPEYIRLQTEAFNRLINNQMKEFYHFAGLRIEAELFYEKLIPGVQGMYNFTSRDLYVMPSVKFKPADGVTISAGLENYSAVKGGLYDFIDDFMNAAYFSLRIDF